MNRLHTSVTSHRKNKVSGYRRFKKTRKGWKVIRARRKKGRKIL